MPSASRRRISVDLSTAEAVGVIHNTMDQLNSLWDEIHMDESQRMSRVECFYGHIKALMDEMLDSEGAMVKCVKASVNEWLPEINGMRAELHLPPFEVYHYPAESVGLYRALDKERQRLKSLKEDRVNGQRQMVDEVRSIAMRIGEEAGELPDVQKVWENDILTTLQERVVELSRELSERIGKARQWQTDLQRWFHQTGKKPEDDDATKVFLELDLEDPERVFDQSFMDNFKDVHQSAMVNYEEWIELAQFSYDEAIVKLGELWEQCHIPQTIRQFPREFNPSTHTASDLAKIQQEVEKLSRFHQERQDVYAKLKEWKTLWMEKVEYESHASDKSAYTNRGGQLQVTLQRQKYINAHLPVILRELKSETEKYNAKHGPTDAILIDGQTPCEHVEWIMDEYKAQRELERLRKKQATFAPNATLQKLTPRKRIADGLFASPANSSKIAKTMSHSRMPPRANHKFAEYGTPIKFHPLSASVTSLHSVINPMGPKTSSPKGMTVSQQLPPLSERKYKFASKLPTPLKSKNHAS